MAIATMGQYWDIRMKGEDPSTLAATTENNTSFTLNTGQANEGAVVDGNWVITADATSGIAGQRWRVVPTTDSLTLVGVFFYSNTSDIPVSGHPLLILQNANGKISVESDGTSTGLNLVGSSTSGTSTQISVSDLDLDMGEMDARPIMVRLTLTGSTGKFYINEMMEDDDGISKEIDLGVASVDGDGRYIQFGNHGGNGKTVTWCNVYATTLGAFSPDELALSTYTTDTLLRLGFSLIQTLKDSKRPHIKNFVDDSSIIYGYDLSGNMINRLTPPTIHVILREARTPEFAALSGARLTQTYEIEVYVTTKGTDYKNAYRSGFDIMGDVVDEVLLTTGLKGTTDALTGFNTAFDTKLDDDEVICIHRTVFEFMRRVQVPVR